ncbi:MAG: glycosyltransferase [Sedimentisphaerales bacterium]
MDRETRGEVEMVRPRVETPPEPLLPDGRRDRDDGASVFEDSAELDSTRQPQRTDSVALLSLVIPVFNEQKNLDALIDRCVGTCDAMRRPYELILVDDGSKDGSQELITEAARKHNGKIVGVLLNRNYGQHAAVIAGFEQSRGSIVVTLDADLQNPPEEIPRLVAKIEEGFDVVGSLRVPRRDSIFRRMASAVVNRVAQKATGVMMHDYGCMLRAYRRHVIDAILQCDERSTFIPVLATSTACGSSSTCSSTC